MFGFSLKILSDIDVAKLKDTPLEQVLLYNALDSKHTHRLFLEFKKQIEYENQETVYQMQIDRIPSAVLMQFYGLTPNQEFIKDQASKCQADLLQAETAFSQVPEVRQMIEKYGKCSPYSNKDIGILMHEFIGIPSTQTSFDEEALIPMKHPIAPILLDIRGVSKLYSTYIQPLNVEDTDGSRCIFPDGKVHAQVKTTSTITGRLSIANPGLQQIPKEIRVCYKADPGQMLLALDMGQIEYRVIASLTKDQKMVEAIVNGLDIHMDWAKKMVEYFPKSANPDDPKAMKALRQRVKSDFVFALCFGSESDSVAKRFRADRSRMAELTTAFWTEHKAVYEFQKRLEMDHNTKGYISSPFGRKYRAPLKWNDICNYPIQGTASDIVVNAQNKLAKLSVELNDPELCPRINGHDQLCFYVSESRLEILLPKILSIFLDTSEYDDWLLVPLTAEVELGPNWGNLTSLGVFSSTDWSK